MSGNQIWPVTALNYNTSFRISMADTTSRAYEMFQSANAISSCVKRGSHNRHVTVAARRASNARVEVICDRCQQSTFVLR